MNPALIYRAAAVLGDPIGGEFDGTMSDALDTMTAVAYGELQERPDGRAQTRLTAMLRASDRDRVAELCAAALLRLAAGDGSEVDR